MARSLEAIGADAKATTAEKGITAAESAKIDFDESSLEALEEEIRSVDLPAAHNPENYTREYQKELEEHRGKNDAIISYLDETQSNLRKELDAHIEALASLRVSLREKRKNMRKNDAGAARLDTIETEQVRGIREVGRIKAEMDGRDENFESMLAVVKPNYRNAETLSAALPHRFNPESGGYDNLKPKDLSNLDNFTGHTEGHIREVHEKMKGMQSALGGVIGKNGGMLDNNTMDAAIAFHDSGMDANLSRRWAPGFFSAFRGDVLSMGPSREPRDRHIITGAANVLRHREELEGKGANADQAAFLIYLHSKSGFDDRMMKKTDPRDLNSEKVIVDAATRFAEDVKNEGVTWDMSWMKGRNGEFDPEVLKKVTISASLMRLADANRDGKRLYAQNGSEYIFNDAKLKEETNYKGHADLKERRLKEVESIRITYSGGGEVSNPESKAIVYGERNISSMNLGADKDGRLVYRFVVGDANKALGCTAYAIWERVAEINNSAFAGMGGRIEIACEEGNTAELLRCLRNTSDDKDNLSKNVYRLPAGWSVN